MLQNIINYRIKKDNKRVFLSNLLVALTSLMYIFFYFFTIYMILNIKEVGLI